ASSGAEGLASTIVARPAVTVLTPSQYVGWDMLNDIAALGVPVVVVADESERGRANAAGAASLIPTPVDSAALAAAAARFARPAEQARPAEAPVVLADAKGRARA